MRTTLAFALVGVVAAAGCGDDNKNTPDAAIDARPIDAPLPLAVLSLSPLTSDFGSVLIGQTSSAMTFTVTNTTAGDASGPISATIMGSGAANFAVETNGCTTLASHATCTVTVSFTPQAGTGTSRTANLVVSASPGGSVSATLDGTATPIGALSINPSTNAFGNVIVGSTSTSSATFTVTNTGGASVGPLTTTAAGSDPGDFQKVTDTCNGQSLAAAATCTLTVNFKPTTAGAKTASFTVAAGTNTVNAIVTGTGIPPALIQINPSLQDFGTVQTGMSSGNVTLTVTNAGGSPSGALSQTLTGADAASFAVVSGNCAGTTLAPAATCNVIIRFSPASNGAKAAQFSITGTPGGTANTTLLGTGQPPGQLTITPSPVTFADTTVGQASASQLFTVTNTGGSATTAIITSLAGNDPSHFTIVAGSNGCQGVVLAGGGICTIAVTFTPTTGGAKSANLTASAVAGGTATAGLSGNGIPPALFVIAPASHDFGALGTGTNSSFFSFTVTNTGGQTSAIPNVVLGGANATQFVLQNGCTAALAPTNTCTVQVRFSPNINGSDTATVTVSGTPGGTAIATVFGQGVNPAALSTAPTTALNFNQDSNGPGGITLIGETTTLTYTITNTGTEPTGAITFTKSGTNQADFTFTSNCTTLPFNMSCTVTVTFTPTSSGTKTAALLASASPGGSVSVAFSGDALPRLQITAPPTNPFDFGAAIVNTTAPTTVTTTFKNNQQQTKTITTAALTDATNFSFVSNGCGGAVTANNSCSATIRFVPTSTGAKTTTLGASVGATGFDTASQVYTGTGVDSLTITGASNAAATCTGTPGSIVCDFGNVALGTVSGTLTVTVANPAGAPLASSISTTLSSTEFQIVSDSCASQSLASGATCNMVVQFQPTGATGARTGALAVTASPAGGSTSLTLKGNAVPGASLTFNPTDTLAFGNTFSGATNDKTIVVTNIGGAPSGVLTFSLTGASGPYSFNPTPVATDCVSGTTVLAPTGSMGSTCNLRVRFTGSGAISVNTPAAVAGVHFSAAGNVGLGTTGHDDTFTATVVPTISIAPTPFSFGLTVVVNTTTTQAFTVTNNSASAVTVTSSVIAGATDTTITANTCTSIPAAGSCTVTVQFAPTTTGDSSRTLTVNSANGIAIATMTAHVLTPSSLAWSPPSADLGSALAAAANGGSATFTLTNSGETAAPIAVAIDDTTNYTLTKTCTASLAGNSTCTATVKFTPPAAATTGVKPAVVTSGGAGPVTAGVTAAVVTSGSLVITPPTASFADTITNSPSATVNVLTVVNTAATTTAFTATASANFAISATTCGASLAAGAQCTISTTFTPTTAGLKFGTLTLSTGAYTALSGTGLAPASVNFTTATTRAYGMVAVGDSGTFTFSMKNTGGVTAGVLSTGALGGTDPGSFQIATDGCTGKSLAANATCDIIVNFKPAGVGAKASNFIVTSSSLTGSPVTVTLSGTGVLQAVLGITPSVAQTVAASPVGHVATTTDFTIQNGGDVATSGPLTVALSNANDFALVGGANVCVSGTTILAPAGICHVYVQFTPSAIGNLGTSVTVTAQAGPSPTQVTNTVQGTGTSTVTVSPATQSFGLTVPNHTASAAFTFTFTNNADTATGILHTILGGADSTSFSITTDNCAGKTLASTGTCTILVKFTPQTAGAKNAALDVTGAVGQTRATLTGTSI